MIKTAFTCNSLKLSQYLSLIPIFLSTFNTRKLKGKCTSAIARYFKIGDDAIFLFGSARMGLYSLLQADSSSKRNEVIVAGYTCVVVTNAIKYAGLEAIYIDVEEENLNIDPELLRKAITSNTKAIIFTHNFGISCEYVGEFKEAYPEIMIIEDAAHTFGSVTKNGVKVGLLGNASFFSLEYSKPLTTGMGGIVIVNDPKLRESLRTSYNKLPAYPFFTNLRILVSLKIHVLSSSRYTASLKRWMSGFLYITGFLYKSPPAELKGGRPSHYPVKLSPYLAHLLYLQIKNIEEINHKKDALVKQYFETLKDIPGIRQYYSTDYNYVRYPVLFDKDVSPEKIHAIKSALKKAGIEAGEWFNDVVHPKGSYRYCYIDGSCPVGESVSERMINFPVTIHRQLIDKDFMKIREIMSHHLELPSSNES